MDLLKRVFTLFEHMSLKGRNFAVLASENNLHLFFLLSSTSLQSHPQLTDKLHESKSNSIAIRKKVKEETRLKDHSDHSESDAQKRLQKPANPADGFL